MSRTFRSLIAVALAAAAWAAVRTEFPSDADPGPPYYARLERGFIIQDGETVAVPFYRLPSCVPPDFNLLNFFDAPRAFGCDLTIEGFDLWESGPPPADLAPIHSESRGLGAVPVWFFDRAEFIAARRGGLTLAELEGLSSRRVGYAYFYEETLRPDEAAQVPTKTIVALGALEDGTGFQIHVTTGPGKGHMSISLR